MDEGSAHPVVPIDASHTGQIMHGMQWGRGPRTRLAARARSPKIEEHSVHSHPENSWPLKHASVISVRSFSGKIDESLSIYSIILIRLQVFVGA